MFPVVDGEGHIKLRVGPATAGSPGNPPTASVWCPRSGKGADHSPQGGSEMPSRRDVCGQILKAGWGDFEYGIRCGRQYGRGHVGGFDFLFREGERTLVSWSGITRVLSSSFLGRTRIGKESGPIESSRGLDGYENFTIEEIILGVMSVRFDENTVCGCHCSLFRSNLPLLGMNYQPKGKYEEVSMAVTIGAD